MSESRGPSEKTERPYDAFKSKTDWETLLKELKDHASVQNSIPSARSETRSPAYETEKPYISSNSGGSGGSGPRCGCIIFLIIAVLFIVWIIIRLC